MPKTANQIRQDYLDFFTQRGHTEVPSAPLVPGGDATLLFTNSGMVQFKDVFLGTDKRDYNRAVDSQKCLRVAGKHNDLEDVGTDDTHHTFFEMLGNWSFGDYYKKEAIAWAWELLTQTWGLPADRLYASVFKDDQGEIETDKEAADNWLAQPGFVPEHLVYYGRKDNFWEMADTGPCGPNSEIYYDFGPEYGEIQKNTDGELALDSPRFVEIWNLVFIQYNRTGPKDLKPLPAKHVDTGMGLERIVSVLQQAKGNYRTDLFTPLIAKVQELAGQTDAERDANFTPYRVIADHARAATFLIAEGVVPGNVGRNYVARMIIRRAARFGTKLGLTEPFMAQVAEAIIAHYGEAYPELVKNRSAILDGLTREEEQFQRTVESGMAKLDALFAGLPAGGTLDGAQAFDLYATYGLPLELTRDVARERGYGVDEAGFHAAMEQHRTASGAGQAMGALGGEQAEAFASVVQQLQADGKLSDKGVKYDPYEDLDELDTKGEVLALVKNGQPLQQAAAGDTVAIILPKTPFYIAAGGQVSDTGVIQAADGSWAIRVSEMQQPAAGAIVHIGEVVEGAPRVGDAAIARVDARRRQDIMRNHTATHLLHAALHQVVGEHARQAGSLVAPDRLRFDFNNPEAVSKDAIVQIEDQVNAWVLDNYELEKETKSLEQAKKEGATALFGEKYGDRVRTIAIGQEDAPFSYELCGGTHVEHTGDIGLFLIVSEGSAAAGIRRIEAVTGREAYALAKTRNAALQEAARTLKTTPDDVPAKTAALQSELSQLNKELAAARRAQAQQSLGDLLTNLPQVSGVPVLAAAVPGADADALRALADKFRQQHASGVALLAAVADGSVTLIAAVTKDLVARGLQAGELAKQAASVLDGRGGGKPELAQAGGVDNGKLDEALAMAAKWVGEKLG
ncbi:MAG: alanine--tRNA ligase [Anaerolineales bacterium]|nr:MAG: alanine--tRNA ligase [Anaerolineales bacterium]